MGISSRHGLERRARCGGAGGHPREGGRLWRQPAAQRGTHQRWEDRAHLRGALATGRLLAADERRGHLRDEAIQVPERLHHS